MAGKVKWLAPLDYASGKTFGLQERFVSTYRELTDRRGCAYQWHKRNYEVHPLTSSEMSKRSLFTTSSKKVKAIMSDQTLYEKWQAAFASAQADGDVTQKTLRGYVFANCMAGTVTDSNEPQAAA